MIAIPGNVRVWLATGHTDMRRGFPSLARLVQEGLKRDPHIGDLYVFRGRRSDLIKIIWHDGQGACLFTKRLERGRFLWPSSLQRAMRRSRPSRLGVFGDVDVRCCGLASKSYGLKPCNFCLVAL
jgi:transposase